MAEETEGQEHGPSATGLGADPAAMAFALGRPGALDPPAAAYLEEQTRLSRNQSRLAQLQSQNLVEQNAFELSHLKWRRFNDRMRGLLQVIVVVLSLAVFAGLCAAVWSASHDHGLVIEAFSVPPDMAARGITGEVVAAQLQDRLAALQDATDSSRPAESYASNWGNDIKVEIPETGVSIGEFYKYLASWLGHETHITGEVYRTANGIAVTARVSAGGSATASGAETQLDALIQQAAEKVYERTQPYRYAVYIQDVAHPQFARSRAILERLAAEGSPHERAWAISGLGALESSAGDFQRSLADSRQAIALNPDLLVAYNNVAIGESTLGHEEDLLTVLKADTDVLLNDKAGEVSDRARAIMLPNGQATLAYTLADFGTALRFSEDAARTPDFGHIVESSRDAIATDLAALHEITAARQTWRDLPDADSNAVRGIRAVREIVLLYQLGDWSLLAARHTTLETDFRAAYIARGASRAFVDELYRRRIWPFVATAMAMTGDFARAHALIDRTPPDCDACIRARGDIDTRQKNWDGAAYWFAREVAQAPSVPLGYSKWGAMLLAKGDFDGAITKFAQANAKGPHFADPLEMWGEALMLMNRSDLALAKFEGADKYAPNWGRLHLKWGEALWWAGKHDDAKMQFSIARGLDLSTADNAELAKVNAHG
jgi:tetratricopeptide (TPR) repeat protein